MKEEALKINVEQKVSTKPVKESIRWSEKMKERENPIQVKLNKSA
jgi:hypothetical protein